MPDAWDPQIYRELAHAWRNRANALPEADPTREACVGIAQDYERLAKLIEAQRKRAGEEAPNWQGTWELPT